MTKEQFVEHIKSIGFSTRGIYPNEFIWDSEGKKTNIRLCSDCLEYRINNMITLHVSYNKIRIELDVEKNWETITISDKNSKENYGFFIQMYNRKN